MSSPPTVPQYEALCATVLSGGRGNPEAFRAANLELMAYGSAPGHIGLLKAVLDGSSDSSAILFAAQSLARIFTDHWNSFSDSARVTIRALCAGAGKAQMGLEENASHPAQSAACGQLRCPLLRYPRRFTRLRLFRPRSFLLSSLDRQTAFFLSSAGDELLGMLGSKGAALSEAATLQIVLLICRMTKFGWLDDGATVAAVAGGGADGGAALATQVGMRSIVAHCTRFLEVRARDWALCGYLWLAAMPRCTCWK